VSQPREVTVAVDAMGGDHAPAAVLEGVTAALAADPGLRIALTGPAEVVHAFADRHPHVTPVPTTEVIGMDEHPANAVRGKKDSSIVVGCRLVKERKADAFFSAGNTGACMAAATLVMGRLRGVARPAIATLVPARNRRVVLLDAGANAEAKAEHLVQFAHMGAAYSRVVVGVEHPTVGLLSIGEEPSKGTPLVQEAHALMAEQVPGFAGNVEGKDIPWGKTDVVVTDGFTGNVSLKLMEGLAAELLGQVKDAMTATAATKVAAAVLRPSLSRLKEELDPDATGGAPLLGVDGVCIIGHGSSGPKAVCAALRVAATAVRGELVAGISSAVGSPV
jgi:phosphate acyltransferase